MYIYNMCENHVKITIYLSLYIYSFPIIALAIGVLTVLYKGPWLVCGNVARAAHHLCL